MVFPKSPVGTDRMFESDQGCRDHPSDSGCRKVSRAGLRVTRAADAGTPSTHERARTKYRSDELLGPRRVFETPLASPSACPLFSRPNPVRRFRIWKDASTTFAKKYLSANVMSSPVPGLRLLDTSRTRGGQGEDLDEDDVWNVADDDDDAKSSSGASENEASDADSEHFDAQDDPTVAYVSEGHLDLGDDAGSLSGWKSSVPRAIARPAAEYGIPGIAHLSNHDLYDAFQEKPRTVSASLGRLELGRTAESLPAADPFAADRIDEEDARASRDGGVQKPSLLVYGSFREGFVPPHVYATTHSTYSSAHGAGYMEAHLKARADLGEPVGPGDLNYGSVVSGKGHTLKGREALKARTAALRSTGFLERDRDPPGTPKGYLEPPRQTGTPTISGFEVEVSVPGEVAGRT